MKVLEVRSLRVRFDTPAGPLQAVDEFSLELEAGETVALVGESGSGKSVASQAILGLIPRPPGVIETGEVLLSGENLLSASPERLRQIRGREIAIVFQDPTASLHPLLPIGLQMSEVLEVHEGLSRRAARVRCAKALGEVGLSDPEKRLDSYPHELSGGMRQRVLIAMALLCNPKVLIADEPTTALDSTVQVQILELLRKLQHEHGTAILFVSHDLGLVARVAKRVQVMYAGRVVEIADAEELYARPMHPYTLGLLQSVPKLSRSGEVRLESIPGAPPDPLQHVVGCAFAPRCSFVVDQCTKHRPPLAATARSVLDVVLVGGRRSACFERERVGRTVTKPGALPGDLGRMR
ncbi:MAG TPA: ABC transporter ATP-binding protein [Planctomycetota bacterium]|nr:ABC transporter ATP-binding protein [Planctomycetota bacterium]